MLQQRPLGTFDETNGSRDIYETTVDDDVQFDSSVNQCPECDGRVTTNAAETVCDDRGLVIDDQQIDYGPEWRSFDADDRERTGAPLTTARRNRGLSTEIGHGVDGKGNTLSGRNRRQLSRLRREHKRGQRQSAAEQNLAHGLGGSGGSSAQSASPSRFVTGVPALPERPVRGSLSRPVDRGDGAASVYGACRCSGPSRTLDGVSEPARVGQASVTNAYKTLNRGLDLARKARRTE